MTDATLFIVAHNIRLNGKREGKKNLDGDAEIVNPNLIRTDKSHSYAGGFYHCGIDLQ